MERVGHARIPVHLNAVLIGEKTVPKGCKVRNVSGQGMLLTCDADGRMLTFRDGDHVDIHLLFQRPDGTKYLTTSAIVRHVDANGIGVKFSDPDAQLINLIESYRIDQSQGLEGTLSHQQTAPRAEGHEATVISLDSRGSGRAGRRQPPVDVSSRRYYYLGLLSLLMAIGIISAGYLGTAGLGKRVSGLEALSRGLDSQLPRSRTQPGPGGETGGYSSDRGSQLKPDHSELAAVPERSGDTPAPVGVPAPIPSSAKAESPVIDDELGGAPAAGISHQDETAVSLTRDAAPAAGQGSSPGDTDRLAAGIRGPWVINLMSSPSKPEADRFADRAREKGIPVEQRSVTLKGREYFRVQLTGFRTEKQARDAADPIKEKLRLKDVWIFKPAV
jgi:hypothetical protein